MANVPDKDHIVRYVRPSKIKGDGSVSGAEFRLRPAEPGVSVNWLEIFGSNKAFQLNEVRRLSRLRLSPNGRFAELNVGEVKQKLAMEVDNANIIHDPLVADNGFEADPSHAQIVGLPPGDSDFAMFIGDLAAECILKTYPVRS